MNTLVALALCAIVTSVPVVLVWEVIDLVRIAYEPEVVP